MNEVEHRADDAAPYPAARSDEDGLLGRLELIEAQPLSERAAGFEQVHDELLRELQRSDRLGE